MIDVPAQVLADDIAVGAVYFYTVEPCRLCAPGSGYKIAGQLFGFSQAEGARAGYVTLRVGVPGSAGERMPA